MTLKKNAFSFIVTAPDGSIGKIYSYICDSLVKSPPKFNVMVDGTILEDFTVESVMDTC